MQLHSNNKGSDTGKKDIIPYGKHQGKTVKWVLENDKKYSDWMTKEGLWRKWGLSQITSASSSKSKPEKKQYSSSSSYPGKSKQSSYGYSDPPPWEELDKKEEKKVKKEYIRENGDVLIGLREIPVPPIENKWIEEAKKLLECLYKEKDVSRELKERIEDILYMPIEN